MRAIDGGGSRRTGAAEQAQRRAAEEARRRAAEEARRKAAEEARRRLLEREDRFERTPTAGPFAARPTSTPAAQGTPSITGSAPPPPGTMVSPTDQAELARLEHRLGEMGRSPQEIQAAVVRLRLSQIERESAALAALGPAALLPQGQAAEATAQQRLDHYIRDVDSIYSGLAPLDREQLGLLVRLENVQARGVTLQALQMEARLAGLQLERAALERQQALAAGAPAATLAHWDAQIAAARARLEGDPAVGTRIQELQGQRDSIQRTLWLTDPLRTPETEQRMRQEMAALDARIAETRLLLPENSLLVRLDAAQARYDEAAQQLAAQQGELLQALEDYRAGVARTADQGQQVITELRTGNDLASTRPDLDQALAELSAILSCATPEELQAALDRIETLPEGDFLLMRLQDVDALGADPRLRIMSGREIGVPTGLGRFAEELLMNTLLLGIPSYIENQRIVNTPGASPALVGEAQLGLVFDYVGFALTVAGPVIKGVQVLARGGRTVVEFTPEMRTALRAAGYADEAIEQLALRLDDAARSGRALQELLLTSRPEEASTLIDLMGRSLPLERTAMRSVPGLDAPVSQLVQRPAEVVDFLIGSAPDARTAFWGLVREGRSLDDARTIMTLVRNGRPLDDIQRALASGRRLDDLVAETLFRTVGAEEAHRLSGIPQSFLSGGSMDDLAALAREHGSDILVRDTNRSLEATMAAHWPKDPAAHFVIDGIDVKVSSVPQMTPRGLIRFKTDGSARVVLQVQQGSSWVSAGEYVVHTNDGWRLVPEGDLATMPREWWAMGGDIDLLAVIERRGEGFVPQPRTEALRAELNEIATVPEPLRDQGVPGLFMHGSSLSYANTNRGWTPALAFTAEGRMVWLATDDAVEYWFKLRGVAAEPYWRPDVLDFVAGLPIPSSASTYLAGTALGNVPEVMEALNAPPVSWPEADETPTPPETAPTATPTVTPSPPQATPGPAPAPVPTATPTPHP